MVPPVVRFVIPIIFLSVVPAHAKGPTVQISISGPELEVPLHSSSSSLIAPNVWMGGIFDRDSGPIEYEADESKMYRIHFWTRSTPDGTNLVYVVLYFWNEELDRAIVCLPGERSKWYWLNLSTIGRGDEDGSCFYANATWGAAVAETIRNSR